MDVCRAKKNGRDNKKETHEKKKKKDEKINHEEFERQRKRCQINKWQGPAGIIATLLYLEEEDGTTTHNVCAIIYFQGKQLVVKCLESARWVNNSLSQSMPRCPPC
jgi:hypothetical protein